MNALNIEGLTKTFGGEKALDEVSLCVAAGEIHGLIGRNGSGKSTLIKVLSGFHAPDACRSFSVADRHVEFPIPPGGSAGLGLTFVHQDLGLIPSLSILENLRIGRYQAKSLGRVRWSDERATVASQLREFGIDASVDSLIGKIPPVERALIAITRALSDTRRHQGGVLILDEPTSFLPKDGVARLFEGMKRVASEGLGVVFVSHRLDEVRGITDRISVLRDGQMVGTVDSSNVEEDELIEMMLGRRTEQSYPSVEGEFGDTLLSVDSLSGSHIDGLSFKVRKGEILGLTGLAGMGHEQVVQLIFGAIKAASGTIEIDGTVCQLTDMTPSRAIELGIGLLPADRLVASGVGSLTIGENVSLPVLNSFFKGGRLRANTEYDHVETVLKSLDVRPPRPERTLNSLSGGNQQKALLGKWLQRGPKVMLLDEPSQGVDIGARGEIFTRIRNMAIDGGAVVLASTDYGDLAHVCDRVLVFRYGKVVAEATGEALAEDRLVELSYSSGAGKDQQTFAP